MPPSRRWLPAQLWPAGAHADPQAPLARLAHGADHVGLVAASTITSG